MRQSPTGTGGRGMMGKMAHGVAGVGHTVAHGVHTLSHLGKGSTHSKTTMSVEEEIRIIKKNLKELQDQKRWLINPASKRMQLWDIAMMLALSFTAVWTPYEVAFVETKVDMIFVVNRFVDLLFIIDTVLNFFLIYKDKNGVPITNLAQIRRRYLRTWFPLDVITILPFDSLKFVINTDDGGNQKDRAQIFRLLRLLRLIKLFRILRGSRIIIRWERRFSVTHSTKTLLTLTLSIVFVQHWLACAWSIVPMLQSAQTYTWMSYQFKLRAEAIPGLIGTDCLDETIPNAAHRPDCADFFFNEVYIQSSAVFFDYGGLQPQNSVEFGICGWLKMFKEIFWAIVVGTICGISAIGDPVLTVFHNQRDEINRYMNKMGTNQDLRERVREFLDHELALMQLNHRTQTLKLIPHKLAGEIASSVHFIENNEIIWLACGGMGRAGWNDALRYSWDGLLSKLVVGMDYKIYLKGDYIIYNEIETDMHAHHSGVVVTIDKYTQVTSMIHCGSNRRVWGEGFLLFNPRLKKKMLVKAMTYACVGVLSADTMVDIMESFPHVISKIRVGMGWLAFCRYASFLLHHKFGANAGSADPMRAATAAGTNPLCDGLPHAKRFSKLVIATQLNMADPDLEKEHLAHFVDSSEPRPQPTSSPWTEDPAALIGSGEGTGEGGASVSAAAALSAGNKPTDMSFGPPSFFHSQGGPPQSGPTAEPVVHLQNANPSDLPTGGEVNEQLAKRRIFI